jgi:Fe-S-cluster containining protein
VQNPDSFDRIVSYFHALANEPFEYRGTKYEPYSELVLSDKVFRDYTCPEGCGACCMKVSLVFDRARDGTQPNALETADKIWKESVVLEDFTVNGRVLDFPVDRQEDNPGRFCKHLSPTGRCGVYTYRPLPCRFELFKFVHKVSEDRAYAMVRLPGRAYKLTRIDSERGAKCEIRPFNKELTESHINDLRILESWMYTFCIRNDIPRVIRYLESGPYPVPLVIKRTLKRGLL